MVRRWSSVNRFNFSLKNKTKKFFFFKKSSKYRVFKITVSVRRFFRKYTKFRRKAFNRLRHKTNWLIYSNVLKFWSFDYLNTKTFAKKTWIAGSQQFNIVAFNWSSVKNINSDIFFNYSFNILNLNFFFLYNKNSFRHNLNFIFWNKFKNISICLTEDFQTQEFDSTPSLFYYDELFYEIPSDFNNNGLSLFNSNFFFFFETNNSITLKQSLTFYNICRYLTILDILN